MPYISASIIMQLMTSAIPSLEALKKEGEQGRKKLNQYTRYLTVLIAMFQSYGIAVGLESMHGSFGTAVIDPGLFFRFSCRHHPGRRHHVPDVDRRADHRPRHRQRHQPDHHGRHRRQPAERACASMLELGRTGALSPFFILLFVVIAVLTIAAIVFVERAQRRIPVQYPKRQVGNRMFGGDTTHMPLKINTSGVIPPIFASSILLIPATIAGFATNAPGLGAVASPASSRHGQPLYMALYAFMIIFFSYFYTAVVFNPEETADNLKKYGGFIPGIRPGSATAEYFDRILTRLTTVGGIYLVVVCLLPEVADQRLRPAVLFRRHLDPDRGVGDDGYGHADPVASAGASI